MSIYRHIAAAGLIGVVLLTGAAQQSSAQAPTATAADNDETLKSRITASLKKDVNMAAREINVVVDKGVVTLKGIVRDGSEKTRAARLATIAGVSEVHNELRVDAAAVKTGVAKAIDATIKASQKAAEKSKEVAGTTADKTKEIAGTTAEKTKEVAETTADKTKEVASATGEAITDGWITGKVKSKFLDETLLKNSDINVDTNNHVVTLKGTVASAAASTRAETIAGGTEGVTRVVNLLVVK